MSFLGISEGTLETTYDDMEFTQKFAVTQRNLVGVVGFSHIQQGSTVQATWFSPDDRNMPMGRTSIQIASGATVARFTLSSVEDWEPSPYMLDIRAWTGEGEQRKTASGSVQFFIGMADEEIREYLETYEEWQRRQQEKQAAARAESEREQELTAQAKDTMKSPIAVLGLKHDLTANGGMEYVFLDTRDQQPLTESATPSVLLSGEVRQMYLVNAKGDAILSVLGDGTKRVAKTGDAVLRELNLRNDSFTVTVLRAGTVVLGWQEKSAQCTVELRWAQDQYSLGEARCEEGGS